MARARHYLLTSRLRLAQLHPVIEAPISYPERLLTMGEFIFAVLQLVGLFTGKWLLPRVSGGRLILMPLDAPSEPFRLSPYKRLPNGQIGVDRLFFTSLAALFYVIVIVGLCCLFL